jgi:hypothetical protein
MNRWFVYRTVPHLSRTRYPVPNKRPPQASRCLGQLHHPHTLQIGVLCSLIAASTGELVDFREVYRELVEDGTWDGTSRAEVDARHAQFDREQAALALASEEAAIAEAEATAQFMREDFDRRAAELDSAA